MITLNSTSIYIYGSHSITSNVHNLIHVTDDVIRFGNLNNISTYPFENRLVMLTSKLKKCNKPLEQIARRISEIKMVTDKEDPSKSTKPISRAYPILKDPIEESRISFATLIFEDDYRLSTKKIGDNNWCLVKTSGCKTIF